MKKRNLFLALAAVAIIFFFAAKLGKKTTASPEQSKIQPINVSVRSAADSKIFSKKVTYAANVVGDQEIKITAKAAGIAQSVNFNLGSAVAAGALLVRIDDSGNNLDQGSTGFQSSQVQQSDLASKQAKKAYALAKDNYENIRSATSSTDAQIEAAKTQRDIAKLQYENATIGLNSNLDNRLITSPISGIVTQKNVSVGDSVSVGQVLATISKTANIKVQFYVDQAQKNQLKAGQEINAKDSEKNDVALIVRNISPVADTATKRFLVEAYPKTRLSNLSSGTVISVEFDTDKKVGDPNNIILPLTAINVGQNENYIFVAENGKAKKTLVTIVKVDGETAEINFDDSENAEIIIEGNKLVQSGSEINIIK